MNPIPDPQNEVIYNLVQQALQQTPSRPFVIAITGACNSGKTTTGQNLQTFLGSDNCVHLDLDDYLIPRSMRFSLGITSCDPRATDFVRARGDVTDLLSYKAIAKPVYDHVLGEAHGEEICEPRDIIVMNGLIALYHGLYDLHHYSFFLDGTKPSQTAQKVQRDLKERGYSAEEVRVLVDGFKADYVTYLEPTKALATVVLDVGIDYVMRPVSFSFDESLVS